MERFYFKYDVPTKTLTIEVTEKLRERALSFFTQFIPIEMLCAEKQICDVVNDEGHIYKNVIRYRTIVMPDKVDLFYSACKSGFIERIKTNIGHSDN